MSAQTLVQLLILLDQITAQVVKLIDSIKGMSESDEDELRKLIGEHRVKNDAAYVDVLARLKAKS